MLSSQQQVSPSRTFVLRRKERDLSELFQVALMFHMYQFVSLPQSPSVCLRVLEEVLRLQVEFFLPYMDFSCTWEARWVVSPSGKVESSVYPWVKSQATLRSYKPVPKVSRLVQWDYLRELISKTKHFWFRKEWINVGQEIPGELSFRSLLPPLPFFSWESAALPLRMGTCLCLLYPLSPLPHTVGRFPSAVCPAQGVS